MASPQIPASASSTTLEDPTILQQQKQDDFNQLQDTRRSLDDAAELYATLSTPVVPSAAAYHLQPHSSAAARAAHKIVQFEDNDRGNPKEWSKVYKWYCTMVVALTCFVVAFASAVITADIEGVVKEFDVSEEVALISISIFVVGFGVGPMVFAPLSEVYGRRIV